MCARACAVRSALNLFLYFSSFDSLISLISFLSDSVLLGVSGIEKKIKLKIIIENMQKLPELRTGRKATFLLTSYLGIVEYPLV